MATKKPKKKAAPRKPRKRSTDSTLVFELLTRIEATVMGLSRDQTALREAIERLDRTINGAAPPVQHVGLSEAELAQHGITASPKEPTDAELLS